jgi:hypothetical protein
MAVCLLRQKTFSRPFFIPRFGGYDWVGMRLDLQRDGPDWQEVAEILTDAASAR